TLSLPAALHHPPPHSLPTRRSSDLPGSKRITPRALTLAIRHDADLGTLLNNVTISRGGVTGVASAEKKAAKAAKAAKKSKKSSRSAEHTSELESRANVAYRLQHEKH